MENNMHEIVKSSDVIGRKVITTEDEDLGKIEDVVMEKVSGKAVYAVLSSGGFLGIGGKLYALTWSTLDYDKSEEAFRLMIDKNKIKSAPSFDKNKWPDFADSNFNRSVTDHYMKP
jgi:hypothetical protein